MVEAIMDALNAEPLLSPATSRLVEDALGFMNIFRESQSAWMVAVAHS